MRDHHYFVYILTNCSRHPFYTGVCHSLPQRHLEHRDKADSGSYTARYNLTRLVYFEGFHYINNAIAREKQIKRWSRAKKIALIESINPNWDDLRRFPVRCSSNSSKATPRSLDFARQGGLRSG